MMTQFNCHNYFSWYFVIGCILTSLISSVICVAVFCRFLYEFFFKRGTSTKQTTANNITHNRQNNENHNHKHTNNNYGHRDDSRMHIDSSIKHICTWTLFWFVFNAIGGNIVLISYLHCYETAINDKNLLFFFSVRTLQITFIIPVLLLYFCFAKRLIDAFKNSIFAISQRLQIILHCVFYLETFIYILIAILTITHRALGDADVMPRLTFVAYMISNILVLIWGIVYVIGFILILYLFFEQLSRCAASLFQGNQETQLKLFDVAMKQLVCCLFAILSSLLGGAFMIALILSSTTFKFAEYLNLNYILAFCYTFLSVDAGINSLCLMLQWPFSQRLYDKLCTKCHKCTQMCCEKCCFKKESFTRDEKNIVLELE